jgi:hypothetical protein
MQPVVEPDRKEALSAELGVPECCGLRCVFWPPGTVLPNARWGGFPVRVNHRRGNTVIAPIDCA